MSSLIFYTSPMSTASVTDEVLAELEHSHSKTLAERVKVDLKAGETKTPHYLSTINPNGLVPAIVHDGVPIWESAAITMYLGELFGVDTKPAPLYPAPGPRRGEAMKWIVWSAVTLFPSGRSLMHAMRLQDGGEEAKEKAMAEIKKTIDVLDGALKGKEYLLGEQYTLADTHLHSFVNGWLPHMGVDLTQWKNVKAWADKVSARPAIMKEYVKS